MAAEKSESPGVLGNLPRSRPGQRSEKRAAASPSTRAKAAHAKTAARKPATRRARPAPKHERPPVAAAAAAPEPERSGGTDPLTGAVQLAGKVAGAGIKTAGALLRRLPGR